MQQLQDSVFSIVKTTNLSPAVFSFLQPTEESSDKTPLGGILNDTKYGWLALGPKFCVVDLRTGLKVAARSFETLYSNSRTMVTSVVELPTPLTDNSKQLIISLQCEDTTSTICVFHVNGSQILRCLQTDLVVTELAVCDSMPDGPFTCFDGVIMAGTSTGEVFVFDLDIAGLIQALKDISQGSEHLIHTESNPSNLTFLPLDALQQIEEQRDLVLANNDHLAILLNENSIMGGQYIFRNPDGTARMKAKRDHVRVTVLQYIPQLGSLAVGFNFGAFQIWNLLNLELEFTSQVNVECLPVTHFGFQEPCDDPRAFCYLWVVFSVLDRFEEEGFPLAVMYSLTYQGKRMLSDTKCLYQEFSMATVRFQVELSAIDDAGHLMGGKCVSCNAYSVNSTLGAEGEDSMLNICQLVWECWVENANNSSQYGMLLFDLDQWYKDQMPATCRLASNAFMSATWCSALSAGACLTLDVRLQPASVSPYTHATRLEEHFYPNSLQYNCICLNTSESCVLNTIGIQRQIISSMDDVGPTALLNPPRLYSACVAAGLTPMEANTYFKNPSQEEQRRYLLSVALEARLSRFLKRCAHDWATGSHAGAGCTLPFLVDWCWQRAIELKENARELTAPLFTSSALPDRNVVRCLEHCVQQLTQLTGLLDAILTKCCNLVVPDALSEMEEKHKGISCVSLYLQVVQWFLRVGLLPEHLDSRDPLPALPYPASSLPSTYTKRRMKLKRLEENSPESSKKSCSLLYIDQLIENEFGGDRIHQMWLKGGSEWNGLYPPPSLHALLRLYLLPDIADEHKHSLVLYLLVDYSVVYDDVRYEAVIRRLMQFPTMFGLSNTAIKATQAFWHLDHRDFDFALDQLQCLTGNTLSEWQHSVVLWSLLKQKKTQAALQYLHVRKPAPVTCRVNDHDKLEDWQSCCNLYLARGLVFEALDVIRMCVQNAASADDKLHLLNFFFKACRNTGQLSKILQVTLLPVEEDVFIKYLQNCNESQTSDILVMYYLQQSRYLEAEQYNNKLKQNKSSRVKESTGSAESLADLIDREGARDAIVEVVCSSLPAITNTVKDFALSEKEVEHHVFAPKPMSVFIQARSPKNTFTYKSSFIQDTIENASETWLNKPKMRKGIKRALNIEDTPFICTPKLTRTKSIFTDSPSEATPPKRPKMDLTATPKTPKCGSNATLSPALGRQLAQLLDMPLVQSPDPNLYERTGAETPHSILKTRRNEAMEASPVDSRYLDESDDELLETGSNYTHYSDSTNKHLRFTIPTASESGSTPSPPAAAAPAPEITHREDDDSHMTSTSHAMDETNPMESPPKKQATEEKVQSRKSYKDTVKSRRSLSISANSSLSDDPNTSIESIADIPITLINPRYSGEMRRRQERLTKEREDSVIEMQVLQDTEMQVTQNTEMQVTQERASQDRELPKTPTSRRGIRTVSGESTPLINRSRSGTPERLDSPITPLRTTRITRSRSRSRTPEISPRAPLPPIPELAAQEACSEPHAPSSAISKPIRSRSRTPERVEKGVIESPRLEAITESPTKSSGSDSPASPSRRSLRSRSRTPEVEIAPEETKPASPRSLRSRTKTPEKIMSPKREQSARVKKPLSRLVLEHNTFAKLKNEEPVPEASESAIECTPMKTIKQVPSLMDVTLSPIVNKSVLQSSTDSVLSETIDKDAKKPEDKSVAELGLKSLPAFTTIHETFFEKSVLHSYQSSIADSSQSIVEDKETNKPDETTNIHLKSLPAFTTLNDSEINKSVLHSYQSSIGEMSQSIQEEKETKITEASTSKFSKFTEIIETNFETSVLKSYQSSMAETSHEMSKDGAESSSRSLKDASLITNDSDVDMKEGNEWKSKIDSQETATVIQKEKEKIGDIEREINEIEGDMTDDDGEEADSSGDEEIVEASNSDVSDEDDSDETADSSDSDEEIISIQDTDDDSSSSENKLEIDEGTSTDADDYDTQKLLHVIAEDNTKENAHVPEETAKTEEVKDVDPLNQAQVSMLTDDNSVLESDQSVNLNYSDDKGIEESNVSREVPMESESTEQQLITDDNIATFKTDNVVATPVSDEKVVFDQNKLQEVSMDTESAVQVLIAVEQIIPVNTDNVVITAVPKDIDVVDSVPAENTEVVADAKPEADCAGTEPVAAVLPVESTISTTNSKDSAKTTTGSESTEQQLITDDNIAPVKTDNVVETPVSDEKVVFDQNKPQEVPMDTESAVQVLIAVEQIIPVYTDNVVITAVPKDIDVVDSVPAENTEVVADAKPEADCAGTEPVAAVLPVESTISTTNIENSAKTTTEVEKVSDKSTKMPVSSAEIKESVISITETQPSLTKKQSPQTTPVLENISDKSKDQQVTSQSNESDVEKESNKPAPRSRKRVKSTSSNKSVTETRTDISEEPKTPITRKRTQSNASNKSVTETEQKTPENIANEEIPTPSRRRAKTPTSAEVRKIMTRRASKEMSEKMDESKDTFDDSVTATPRRRSTRSKAKTIDDNESVTSESSVRSTRSKASEDAGDVKAAPIRKGRKSILSTKPDLSAIPEMITEEESKGTEELMNDYSSSRRLTRHQKAVLESWLEPTSSPSTRPKATRGRRPSAASRTSGVSDRDDDDVSSTHSSEIMDRISLLNKTEFEGSPDTEEYPYTGSPDSIASEASKQRRGRAASEAKSTPKAAKINRRVSVEIGETSLASPSGRRASFQKACSALHALTPSKSRRASTDTRKESVSPLAESPAGSEAEAPARRSRRLPSGAAGASQAKAETGKRTKKSSAQDEK